MGVASVQSTPNGSIRYDGSCAAAGTDDDIDDPIDDDDGVPVVTVAIIDDIDVTAADSVAALFIFSSHCASCSSVGISHARTGLGPSSCVAMAFTYCAS